MKSRVPSAPELIDRFSDLFAMLYEVAEASVEVSLADFSTRRRFFDVFQFASTFRHEARSRLAELRDSSLELQIDTSLANNGLQILHDGHLFRFLKADTGILPDPASMAMESYYEQEMPLFPDLAGEIGVVDHVANLVILWVTDKEHRLKELRLVMPSKQGCIWNEAVPHPAVVKLRLALVADLEPVEDLEFEKEEVEIERKVTQSDDEPKPKK